MRKTSVKKERVCVVCTKVFLSYPSSIRKTSGSASCCSNKCRRKRIPKECQNCQSLFEVRPSETRLKYCSRKCYFFGKRVSREHSLLRHRAETRKRRALKYNALGDFSVKYFVWLCEKLEHKCVMCKKLFSLGELTIDHIVPLSKGGKHDNGNIQPLCMRCNNFKSNRSSFTVPQVQLFFKQYAN